MRRLCWSAIKRVEKCASRFAIFVNNAGLDDSLFQFSTVPLYDWVFPG